tara:strand:+ start:48 stop:233 length:186 start_codon:yes stop_codon:yes gene_type:complete
MSCRIYETWESPLLLHPSFLRLARIYPSEENQQQFRGQDDLVFAQDLEGDDPVSIPFQEEY